MSATLVNFDIKVNGKQVENSKEQYPVLSYKSITYFPLTWEFAVNEFGLGYSWDDNTGLSICKEADDKTTEGISISQTEQNYDVNFRGFTGLESKKCDEN